MTSCAKACEGVQASIPLGVQKGVLKWLFAGGGWSTPSRVLLVMGPRASCAASARPGRWS